MNVLANDDLFKRPIVTRYATNFFLTFSAIGNARSDLCIPDTSEKVVPFISLQSLLWLFTIEQVFLNDITVILFLIVYMSMSSLYET